MSVHLVLEEDVWTTGHNISIRGDRDATKDLHAMVVTYRQSLEFPFHIEVEPLGAALAKDVPDSFYTLTTLMTVHVSCITHAVRLKRACVNAVVQGS